MELVLWIVVFIVSLVALVKGADWFTQSAEKIGLALGLSPFIVGVTIVGIGTSFPELISSFAAALKGVPNVVAANVVGSNIANILLIVGLSAVLGRTLVVTKNLIDLDLPLLAIGTVIFLGAAWDRKITSGESILMLITYIIYLLYTTLHKEDSEEREENFELLPSRQEKRKLILAQKKPTVLRPRLTLKEPLFLVIGCIGLVLGANYLIDSLVKLSDLLNVATGIITITAVAVGTSLPELLVSANAAIKRRSEIALGNVFGSNIFNGFVVVGLPGLFKILPLDEQTFSIGLPFMALATLLFVISGISKRIHVWEGAFYLSLYILFVAKLFNWF